MELALLERYCSDIGCTLASNQIERFVAFQSDLYAANQTMNLTRVPIEDCEVRHFIDSLLVSPYIEKGSKVLDIGTGPGFPAFPLANVRPDLAVAALDSSNKMLGFLKRHPLPNLRIQLGRAEDLKSREGFDVVTGRAAAPLGIFLELAAPQLKLGGAVIPFRTPNEIEVIGTVEADVLGLALESVEKVPLPETDVVRVLPMFRKVRPTPRIYPRTWAQIKAKPF